MENQPTMPVTVKSAIIGKMWINSSKDLVPAAFELPVDMTFNANESYLLGNLTFRTDRNLTNPVNVKAGSKLMFYSNSKRPGFKDADYSVSVLLPVAEADAVIQSSRDGAAAWRDTHPAVAA
jgi:hypothetical protein